MGERITFNASDPPDNLGKRSIIFGLAELVIYVLPVTALVVTLLLPLVQMIREWFR